jgi:hypothetical protein
MTDRRPLLDKNRRRHVRTLERRAKYLEKVLVDPQYDTSAASKQWDRGELAALQFALRTIKNHYREEAPAA